MQPQSPPTYLGTLATAWERYMDAGRLDDATLALMDPVILRSWQRCQPRLDPRARPRRSILQSGAFERVLARQADLVALARPFMEDVYQFTESSGYIIALADSVGCILDVFGDQDAADDLAGHGLVPGAYWDEGRMATNAIALTLREAAPVQVVGPEHYFAAFHDFTFSAAPIHDVRGRIVGALAMAGRRHNTHTHTLAVVMAAARAIENQLQTDLYLQEANRRLGELDTVFRAISEGVVTWDQDGKITHFNDEAGAMLQLTPQAVLGRHLSTILQPPATVLEAIQNRQALRDVEATFTVSDRSVQCLVSLQPIFEGVRGPVGFIATLRPIERVRRLVHRLVGAHARLTLADFLGEAPSIRQARRLARMAARGTAPVLILGEDGSGKDPLARAIHNESQPADGPFLAISCQAIPHELVVSEFLGHEGDAPGEGRPSKFELASGGTLFLDEVEGLTLKAQSALLHVIETGHVMRLGSTRPIPVDVRIIAATAADLEQRAADGRFRPHLYYRLSVFVINLPPLRDRAEDLPLLIERFLARITQQSGRPCWLDDAALHTLQRYPWPGNVRELEDVLERAVAHSESGVIGPADLPAAVRSGRVLRSGSPHPQPVLSFAEAEREAIIQAAWACNGRVTQMARHLGIGRTTLWRKIRDLDLDMIPFKNISATGVSL